MTPDHGIWTNVDKQLKRNITNIIGKKERNRLINNQGFLFRVDQDSNIIEVVPGEDADVTLYNNALKQGSDWHIVRPLGQRTSAVRKRRSLRKKYEDITPETAEKRGGIGHTRKERDLYKGSIKGHKARDVQDAIDTSYPGEEE